MKKIVLIGFGGHAKSIIDSIESSQEYEIVGYVDIEDKGEYRGYVWLGTDENLRQIYERGIKYACISIGYMGEGNLRDDLYSKARALGFDFPAIVDPRAIIAKDVTIEEGVYVAKGAIINSGSYIGKLDIINSGALVEHENIIGDFTHIAVRAVLCGNVVIGDHCMIGASATVIQGKRVESNVQVAAGAVVIDDLKANCKAIGVPAKMVLHGR